MPVHNASSEPPCWKVLAASAPSVAASTTHAQLFTSRKIAVPDQAEVVFDFMAIPSNAIELQAALRVTELDVMNFVRRLQGQKFENKRSPEDEQALAEVRVSVKQALAAKAKAEMDVVKCDKVAGAQVLEPVAESSISTGEDEWVMMMPASEEMWPKVPSKTGVLRPDAPFAKPPQPFMGEAVLEPTPPEVAGPATPRSIGPATPREGPMTPGPATPRSDGTLRGPVTPRSDSSFGSHRNSLKGASGSRTMQ